MAASGNTTIFKGQAFGLIGPRLKAGDKAPAFTCVNSGLELTTLDSTGNKPRLFSVVPSLDTPVCSLQTKKFEEALAGMKDKLASYTVSLDMPFAQKRFCAAEQVTNMQTLSDLHDHSFGKNYGVLIEGLAMPLLSRAVFMVDPDNRLTYVEYVPEVGQHPNYDNALSAVRAVVK
jgi:thiol peroxidase